MIEKAARSPDGQFRVGGAVATGLLETYFRYIEIHDRFCAIGGPEGDPEDTGGDEEDLDEALAEIEERIIASPALTRHDLLGKCALARHLASRIGAAPIDPRLPASILDAVLKLDAPYMRSDEGVCDPAIGDAA